MKERERERQVNGGKKGQWVFSPIHLHGQRRAALERFIGNFTFPHFHWTGGIGPEPCAPWLESIEREKRSVVIKVQNHGETTNFVEGWRIDYTIVPPCVH